VSRAIISHKKISARHAKEVDKKNIPMDIDAETTLDRRIGEETDFESKKFLPSI